METKEEEEKRLIGILTMNRTFGIVIMPYFTTLNEYGFPEISEPATVKNTATDAQLSDVEKKFVSLSEKFAENKIYKLFSKEKTLANFYKKLTQETINDTIRPYIDDVIYQMIVCMKQAQIPLYTKQKGKFDIYEADRIHIEQAYAEPVFHFIKDEEGLKYFINCSINGEIIDLTSSEIEIITSPTCSLLIKNRLVLFKDMDGKKLKPFLKKPYVIVPAVSEEAYIKSFIIPCTKKYKVEIKGINLL